MLSVYVLKLTNNKYYVGKTTNVEQRMIQHRRNEGSEWTQLYKMIEIDNVFNNCDDEDEDKYVIQYMKKYGIDNVRGGSFSELNLSREKKNVLESMIRSSSNLCFKCGSSKHFISECNKNINRRVCFRCGREGHYISNCYARVDINGYEIDDVDEYSSDESDDYYDYYN